MQLSSGSKSTDLVDTQMSTYHDLLLTLNTTCLVWTYTHLTHLHNYPQNFTELEDAAVVLLGGRKFVLQDAKAFMSGMKSRLVVMLNSEDAATTFRWTRAQGLFSRVTLQTCAEYIICRQAVSGWRIEDRR